MRVCIPLMMLAVILPVALVAQTDSANYNISDKAARYLDAKYEKLNGAVTQQTLKMLEKSKRQEQKLQKKLQKIDSAKAATLFANTEAKYQSLVQKLQTPISPNITNPLREYLPGFDSLQTAFKFLGQYGTQTQQLQGVTGQMQQLQGTLQQSNAIQSFLKDREQELQSQLANYKLGNNLLAINKQLYYYQQQMRQYKEIIKDPEKLGEAVLAKVEQLPAFQSFFQKNSYLSQLFGTPQDYGSPASLAGLQTRAQVQQLISQRVGGGSIPGMPGGGGQSMVQQQVQGAQQQLNQLQGNVASAGSGNSNAVMPNFKPNTEKTKTFLQRLEFGFNIQNAQATGSTPSISTLGVSLGYKFSQKATAGIGASFLLGVGRPVNFIQFTSQGVGLRTYVDIKAKGSFWLSGGMEANYYQAFSKLSDIDKNISAWQQSALLGVTKKYKISGNKQGNLQLLYDFLYKQHIPVSTPLVFRMGYSF